MNDIRLAVRALARTPVVAAAAILALALGIGANTAIFSLVNSLILRSLPVAEPGQLGFIVDPTNPSRAWSNLLWEEICSRADRFDGAFAWSPTRLTLNRGGELQFVSAIRASGGFFPVDGDLFFNVISPGWLQTYGVRLLSGRDFLTTDRVNTPPVALVNQAYARRFLDGANPVGQLSERAVPGIGISTPLKVQIVGLVEDTVYRSLRETSVPTMYTSTLQRAEARPFASVSVLASDDPNQISRSVEAAIRRVDPALVWQIRPLNDQIGEAMAQERLVALLSGFFGALALLLSALGLYGVTAFAVNRRRPEIALRMALGAGRGRVVQLVMRRVGALAAIGIACGAVLSMWAVQFLDTLVWGLEPRDPATFLTAAAILAGVTALAAALSAWRVTRTDQASVLKEI